jgi:ABC-type amino acid transport substrate-binding protein
VPAKKTFLDNLEVLGDAIMRIAQFVARLAPLGVFALVAAAAGTLGVSDLGRLQVYLLTYIGASLVLSFWVLPGLVSLLTPIRYGRMLSATQDALLTAFATGNLLIVLPLLSERVKILLDEAGLREPDSESAADLVVPINFTMPNLGKLLSLAFVPFAAWFAGVAVGADRYPMLLASGLVSFFGEVVVALPFLLDQLRIPADLFQVFLAVDVFTGRFGTLLAGAHTVALALLTAAAVGGGLRWRWTAVARYAVVSVLLIVGVLGGLRVFFEVLVPQEYREYHAFVHMEQATEHVPTRMRKLDEVAALEGGERAHRLRAIQRRGTLRAGFTRDSLPFVYRNAKGELVGLEVDMMNLLARELGCELAFVRLERGAVVEALRTGRVDLMLGGLLVTPERAVRVRMSEPYMDATLSLVVRDYARRRFERVDEIASRPGLRIAVLDIPHYRSLLEAAFPKARLSVIESPRSFFTAPQGTYDALLFSAEAGSAWTLVYPEFSVVVPRPSRVAAPIGFALPRDARELITFVDTWISLKKKDGSFERLYDNWILGQGAEPRTPRWSVIRNVLGWVD